MCIIVYQYSETIATHSPLNLLSIKSLYIFRALLAHPQEALYRRRYIGGAWHIAYVLCQLAAPGLEWTFNPGAAN
jgi:hypothetical protein